jgi:hypothetical protein
MVLLSRIGPSQIRYAGKRPFLPDRFTAGQVFLPRIELDGPTQRGGIG